MNPLTPDTIMPRAVNRHLTPLIILQRILKRRDGARPQDLRRQLSRLKRRRHKVIIHVATKTPGVIAVAGAIGIRFYLELRIHGAHDWA